VLNRNDYTIDLHSQTTIKLTTNALCIWDFNGNTQKLFSHKTIFVHKTFQFTSTYSKSL